MGVSIGLPLLDGMIPAFARASRVAVTPPVRLAFVYVPSGIVMKDWTPKDSGKSFEFTRILKPLEPLREDLLVLSGLDERNGNALGDGAGDHARAGAAFLTGVHCRKTEGTDIHNGISADQIAAQALDQRRASHRSSLVAKILGPSAIVIQVTVALIPTASPGVASLRRCLRS